MKRNAQNAKYPQWLKYGAPCCRFISCDGVVRPQYLIPCSLLHIPLAYGFNDAQSMRNDDFYIKSWGGQEMVMSPNHIILY